MKLIVRGALGERSAASARSSYDPAEVDGHLFGLGEANTTSVIYVAIDNGKALAPRPVTEVTGTALHEHVTSGPSAWSSLVDLSENTGDVLDDFGQELMGDREPQPRSVVALDRIELETAGL